MVQKNRHTAPVGWDPVATWYDGWVGTQGSKHHRRLAIPAVLDMLHPREGEAILDLGAGQGVLAPHIAQADAQYTGVEVSPRLLHLARQRHGRCGRFIHGDVRRLSSLPDLHAGAFDGVVFMLSIQDMNPLHEALAAAAWALRPRGRLVMLMTHPCFRIPRQSGWGHDDERNLTYRRVDSYLTPLRIPVKPYGKGRRGTTISYHRPLSEYINALAGCGLLIDSLREITSYKNPDDRAERRANAEIPLFLGLRAVKLSQ
ncbi:MAG TPA: class I SAM-dependent methyltransferase [Chloroflexi bacterium]|jgi:ubiquinone/menaquinone biosynthesis C-methylase UbiE|nr:class I SAM-dependent methyltransferase [Chloroflexota bacterium]